MKTIAKILVRGLLVIVVVVAGLTFYYVAAGVDYRVTATGCGAIQPPVVLPLTWQATSYGGIAKVPPLTVQVDTVLQNGQESVRVKAPAGINYSFAVGSNVKLVQFDGSPLYQRSPFIHASTSLNLGQMRHHNLVLACN